MTHPASSTIPADDLNRKPIVADPDYSSAVRHVAVVGDTYNSILVSGAETGGRYCLIDMIVPMAGTAPAPS